MNSKDEPLITAEEFARMNIDGSVELVRGVIVVSPLTEVRHGVVCANVGEKLRSRTRADNSRVVACGGSGVITHRNPDTVRGPDVLMIARQRLPDRQVPDGFQEVAPDLAVEVVSQYDLYEDLRGKVSEYLLAGVHEVWVAVPELQLVEVHRPHAQPRILRSSELLESPDVLPGFSCPVADFFIGA